jgi:hypothetical protein
VSPRGRTEKFNQETRKPGEEKWLWNREGFQIAREGFQTAMIPTRIADSQDSTRIPDSHDPWGLGYMS